MKSRTSQPTKIQISIGKEDLEEVFVQAIIKAKSEIAEENKKKEKNSPISDSIRNVLISIFLVSALFLIISAIMCIASFIFLDSSLLESLYQYSVFSRVIMFFLCAAGGFLFPAIARSISKEYDRNYLISFSSTIISIIALLVALTKK